MWPLTMSGTIFCAPTLHQVAVFPSVTGSFGVSLPFKIMVPFLFLTPLTTVSSFPSLFGDI